MSGMKVVMLLEAVNPVYRRNRLAKVLKTVRKHKDLEKHWSKVSDKLDADGRKISRPFYKKHGSDFMKWPEAARKAHNALHAKHNNRRSNAEDKVFHHVRQRIKGYQIASGNYEMPDGSRKWKGVPSNPLRKNRNEKLGKHQRDAKTLSDIRKSYKQQRAGQKTESRYYGPGMSGKEPEGPLPDFGAKDYADTAKSQAKKTGGKSTTTGKLWRKAAVSALKQYRKSKAAAKKTEGYAPPVFHRRYDDDDDWESQLSRNERGYGGGSRLKNNKLSKKIDPQKRRDRLAKAVRLFRRQDPARGKAGTPVSYHFKRQGDDIKKVALKKRKTKPASKTESVDAKKRAARIKRLRSYRDKMVKKGNEDKAYKAHKIQAKFSSRRREAKMSADGKTWAGILSKKSNKTESERARKVFKAYRKHMDVKNVPWGDSGEKGKEWQKRASRLKHILARMGGKGGTAGSKGALSDLEHSYLKQAGFIRKNLAKAKKMGRTEKHLDRLRMAHAGNMNLTKSDTFKTKKKLP